jgi:biopolymer transport protein TolR
MVATPMLHNAIRVTLPKGDAKETGTTKQEYIVYVDAQGTIFFNDKQMTADELIKKLKTSNIELHNQTVFVKADTTASYGLIIELVDRIKTMGGIQYVALATTKST